MHFIVQMSYFKPVFPLNDDRIGLQGLDPCADNARDVISISLCLLLWNTKIWIQSLLVKA